MAAGADPLFDCAAEFPDSLNGYTGGGTIAPTVQGWVHRTNDGGGHWSARLCAFPYPIRALRFADARLGWAAGGDVYSSCGGIYSTRDGGATWSSELDAGAEMRALALVRSAPDSVDLWCCGFASNAEGRIYHRRLYLPQGWTSAFGALPAARSVAGASKTGQPSAGRSSTALSSTGGSRTRPSTAGPIRQEAAGSSTGVLTAPGADGRTRVRSFPNPFSPATNLTFFISTPESVLVEIFDPSGRMVRQLRPGMLSSGDHRLVWDGRDQEGQRLSSGVFFYRLRAGHEVHGGSLVLVR